MPTHEWHPTQNSYWFYTTDNTSEQLYSLGPENILVFPPQIGRIEFPQYQESEVKRKSRAFEKLREEFERGWRNPNRAAEEEDQKIFQAAMVLLRRMMEDRKKAVSEEHPEEEKPLRRVLDLRRSE